jgi:hypothetical protein
MFVGALTGAVGRFLVAIAFIYYVFNRDGPFFRKSEGASLGTSSPSTQVRPPPSSRSSLVWSLAELAVSLAAQFEVP